MTWELFYLICFAVGFLFSVLSFLAGTLHVPLPKHFHFHFGGLGHAPGHGPVAHGPISGHARVGHAPGHGTAAKGHVKSRAGGSEFPLVNPMTMAAFLTWFGGTGYLLERFSHIWIFAGLALSTVAGLIGASIVFWFVAKVLMRNERDLDPLDYEMVGVLGKVSSSIRGEGTGEIIFTQEGVRRPCAARSETGESLPKGLEVMVSRYERGIAYVRPWDELADSAGMTATKEGTE